MCYEYYHKCNYCKKTYSCELSNYLCPTINKDANHNMCPDCEELERENFIKMSNEDNDA